ISVFAEPFAHSHEITVRDEGERTSDDGKNNKLSQNHPRANGGHTSQTYGAEARSAGMPGHFLHMWPSVLPNCAFGRPELTCKKPTSILVSVFSSMTC